VRGLKIAGQGGFARIIRGRNETGCAIRIDELGAIARFMEE
jgi:hypothetical protein